MLSDIQKQISNQKQKTMQLSTQQDKSKDAQLKVTQQKLLLNSQNEHQNEHVQFNSQQKNIYMDLSPYHTCESLQQDAISMQMKNNSQQIEDSNSNKNIQIHNNNLKAPYELKFDLQQNVQSQSNLTNSSILKQTQINNNNLKKSTQFNIAQIQQPNKNVYSSAMRQKNICQQCMHKMNQIHEIQFLKNKYHKEYISVRTQLEKLKAQISQLQIHQTQLSSLNLNDIYTDHTNQQKSQKSSFSFQNIQNALLSQRFSLEIEQLLKLIDRLLPLDSKNIQLEPTDIKLLFQLEIKLQKLKNHLGIDTQHKFIAQLFNQLEKFQQTNKKIHQKYKKLIEKIVKTQKQKNKKSKDQFNQVNQKFVLVLNQLNLLKLSNEKLKKQIQNLQIFKNQSSKPELKDSRNAKDITIIQNLIIKQANQKVLTKQAHQKSDNNLHKEINQRLASKQHTQKCFVKQKNEGFSLKLDRTISGNSSQSRNQKQIQVKTQKQIQKYQLKIKNLQKANIKLDKKIKETQLQIVSTKKKAQHDLNQFINKILFNKNLHQRNMGQQTDQIKQIQQKQESLKRSSFQRQKSQKSQSNSLKKQIVEQIASLVFQIFSFTSCESDQEQNVFLPQTQAQIIQMLKHVKRFAMRFDQWQKKKQKQIVDFQKNFLNLLKFLIIHFKVTEQDLLRQITKLKDNQLLIIFIKKYYSKSMQIIEEEERLSNTFTFGQKSESYKDSQSQS